MQHQFNRPYYQKLCKKGHQSFIQVYEWQELVEEAKICPKCKQIFVWSNLVDPTVHCFSLLGEKNQETHNFCSCGFLDLQLYGFDNNLDEPLFLPPSY